MARLMHQLKAPTLDDQFEVLKAARDRTTQGGPTRLKHTIPAIAFGALAVVRGLCAEGKQGQSKAEPVSQNHVIIPFVGTSFKCHCVCAIGRRAVF